MIKRALLILHSLISTETRSTLSFGMYETETTSQFAETLNKNSAEYHKRAQNEHNDKPDD